MSKLIGRKQRLKNKLCDAKLKLETVNDEVEELTSKYIDNAHKYSNE